MRISDWSSDVCSSDLGAISLATLTLEAQYHQRWLSFPGVLATAQVPLATLIITFLFYRSLRLKKDGQPFFWALALFGLCLIGLGVSIWPDVIPARVTIWEAAAPHRSQVFMLVGASIMVRSEEHTSELQSLMRISYAVFCLKKKT